MSERPPPPAETRINLAQVALCKVTRRLAELHGQHQFHALSHVQAASTAIEFDRALMPWVLAGLVRRPDFEAYYALREWPGIYEQLRTELTAPFPRTSIDNTEDVDLEDLLSWWRDWLDEATDS